jgi:D-alanyl-D-alanine dipeptidase
MGTAFDTFSAARTPPTPPACSPPTGSGSARDGGARLQEPAEEWWHYSFDLPDPVRFDLVIR